jgi:CTP:molybdopterin cytidylyltransferase MocA
VSVAAVILAAGASRRLGRPKQDVVLAGETLLQRAVRLAHEASLSPVIVVTRADANYGKTLEPVGALILATNHEADEGIASSIRCGIRIASNHGVTGAVIACCDQPALRAEHLRALIEDERRVTGSAYAGLIGVPAYFPATSFPLLLQLRGDAGARKLLLDAHAISAEDLRLDIDTEQDLASARTFLEAD